MTETMTIAASQTGAPGWLKRAGCTDEHPTVGEWPVRREDLDRVIHEEAEKRGMRILSVDEPPRRRGPIPIWDISEEGQIGDAIIAEAAQLYTYVEWEPFPR